MGIPMPSIHLPKRKPKGESPSSSKITVAGAEGTLRKLGEKDLLLQASTSNRVLRFRLIAKTQFVDKSAKPIRDSLLHPGDHLTIDTNPDDPETAVRVVLDHAGSKQEQETAATPVEEASIHTPDASDLGRSRSVNASSPSSEGNPEPVTTSASPAEGGSNKEDTERPTIRHTNPGDSNNVPAASLPSAAPIGDQVINDARDAAASFTADLPNFLVKQVTTRYQGSGLPVRWRAMDVVTADVASVNGQEDYRNIKINGRPVSSIEDSGAWSTGEFTITLQDILSLSSAAVFTRRGEDRIANRPALVYDLRVEQPNSHWVLVSNNHAREYKPAYKGSIWIDKETHRVLRIEQQALSMPRDYEYDKAETVVEYGFVQIEGKNYLLPVMAENLGCMTGSQNCSRNVIQFQNYRKFGADSTITFGKFRD